MRAAEIVEFSRVGRGDIALVGGKGANLGEMVQAGLPVPPGFVVTAAAYERFIRVTKLKPKIMKLLHKLDPEKSKELHAKALAIQQLILNAKMPADLVKAIDIGYQKLSAKGDVAVAVRSSATAEDLPDASFAGQQDTYLNIIGSDAVCRSVQHAWASLWGARAIYYRSVQGYDHFKVQIAVPVQVMVNSVKAGVMFTVNPKTSDDKALIIEGAYGLGEAVVSGSVTPDHYVVQKSPLKILERTIERQTWQIVRIGKGARSGTRHQTIPARDQKRQKLTDEEILGFAKLGLQVEAHYNFPQDIEWGVDEAGKLWLLQTRPITTLVDKETAAAAEPTAADAKAMAAATVLVKGLGATVGAASGPVRIIHKPSQIDLVKEGEVLVTEMTNPSFVPAMRRAAAIVTDTGGMTSHAAIVSRELGIPCVVGTGTATHALKSGVIVTVDGRSGVIYKGKVLTENSAPTTPVAATGDQMGVPVTATKIYMNLAEPERAKELAALPVDGVGLLRAEFMIAGIGTHPRYLLSEKKEHIFINKLAEGIRTIASAFSPRPVVYRATDFKTNEYRALVGGAKVEPKEENPMIGYRGAMRYIREPDLFALELQVLKQVRESYDLKNVHLMIPFVRTVDELKEVRAMVEKSGLLRDHDFKLWMMVEVPSNIIQLEEFLDVGVDGVSIGSNDLTQLILGIDRDNAKLAETFDERHPAVMAAMEHVVAVCRRRHVTVSICGQAPSVYPEVTEALVRAGTTSLSINPDMAISTRRLVASIERRIVLDGLARGVHGPEGKEIKRLAEAAEKNQ